MVERDRANHRFGGGTNACEQELYLYEIHRKVVYFDEKKNEIQEKNTIESEQHIEEGREKKI